MYKLKPTLPLFARGLGIYSVYQCFEFFTIRNYSLGISNYNPIWANILIIVMFLASIFLIFLKGIRLSLGVLFFSLLYFSYLYPYGWEIHWSYLQWSYLFLFGVAITSPNLKSIHPYINTTFWLIYAVSYSAIGVMKLSNPAFISGNSMFPFLKWNNDAELFPVYFLTHKSVQMLAWSIAIAQTSAPFLITIRLGRKTLWTIITIFHVCTYVFTFLKNISVAMLLFQVLALALLAEEKRYEKFKKGNKRMVQAEPLS